MIQAPIFHVNGDDPEACVRVAQLAFEYRQAFNKDVVIDMVCYRRRGHNEGDDPSMTQPLMYALIEGKRSVRKLYTESLIGRGDITVEEAEQALRDYQGQLERVFTETREAIAASADEGTGEGIEPPAEQTRVGRRRRTADRRRPRGRQADRRRARRRCPRASPCTRSCCRCCSGGPRWRPRAASTGRWASCSRSARCCSRARRSGWPGRTRRRGTFVPAARRAHRPRRPATSTRRSRTSTRARRRFWVYDSLLSEFAAMGFEYGYSVARPDALVLWEAQFGDFVNGAQTIIDEFISSSEQKWGQRSSVVLLLPHGYEGQGPDHSSGRIERFLQLCAEDNMTVALPVDAGVVLPPAALAGLPRAAPAAGRVHAEVDAAAQGGGVGGGGLHLRHVPAGHPRDRGRLDPAAYAGCCSARQGLLRPARRAGQAGDVRRRPVAIVRVEQLYPLPGDEIVEAASAPIPQRRARVGAGGAGQPGAVAVHRAQPAGPPRRPRAALRLPAGRRPRRRPARTRSTTSSSTALVEQAFALPRLTPCTSPTAASRSSSTPRRGAGVAGLAGRAAAASSSTSTRSSRSRSSGWPPGWPASTTRTDRSARLGGRPR